MKDIAFKKNTISKESLPYPIVLYPGFYGAFFGFKKTMNDKDIFFCSCTKVAIQNYIGMQCKNEPAGYYDDNGNRKFFLDYGQFPQLFIDELKNNKIEKNENIIKHINFKNKLCHECNKTTPSYRYCHEMYGEAFKQNYGWYIKKQGYEWGMGTNRINKELCPQEILDLLEIGHEEYFQMIRDNEEFTEEMYELKKKYQKQQRKIKNIIENEVREKFGHKKVGEAWTSETILFYIIESLFPENTILRHYHPDFLDGLELDIFIKELNIGIEYQGIQHYQPVKHWGGQEALEKLQERDKRKKKICDSLGIKLIYFNYDENLDNDFILNKIKHEKK